MVDTMLNARIMKINVTQSLMSGNPDYDQEDGKQNNGITSRTCSDTVINSYFF